MFFFLTNYSPVSNRLISPVSGPGVNTYASQVLSFNLFTEEYPDMRKQDAFGINVKNGGYMWL
jgi:hypothetical protein